MVLSFISAPHGNEDIRSEMKNVARYIIVTKKQFWYFDPIGQHCQTAPSSSYSPLPHHLFALRTD